MEIDCIYANIIEVNVMRQLICENTAWSLDRYVK